MPQAHKKNNTHKAAAERLRSAEQKHRLQVQREHSRALAKIAASKVEARAKLLQARNRSYLNLSRIRNIRDEKELIQKALGRKLISPKQSAQLNAALDARARNLLTRQGYSQLTTKSKVKLVLVHRAYQAGQISKANADALVQQAVPQVSGDWTEVAEAASTEPAVASNSEVAATQDLAAVTAATAADPGIVPSSTFSPSDTAQVKDAYVAAGSSMATAASEAAAEEEEDGDTSTPAAGGEAPKGHNYVLYGGVALVAVGLWYWLSSRPSVTIHT